MLNSVLVICAGASLGALLRWVLGTSLNMLFPAIPLGTLLANLIGGYLIGLVLVVFSGLPELSPAWRLFMITGLLGGLTTFSTFSVEVTILIQQNKWLLALTAISLHVLGSLLMTILGVWTATTLKNGWFD